MGGLHKQEKTWVDMFKKEKQNFMQSTKHETETKHLGTNTIVKQTLFCQFDSQSAKKMKCL